MKGNTKREMQVDVQFPYRRDVSLRLANQTVTTKFVLTFVQTSQISKLTCGAAKSISKLKNNNCEHGTNQTLRRTRVVDERFDGVPAERRRHCRNVGIGAGRQRSIDIAKYV